jgi:hypothetical protein
MSRVGLLAVAVDQAGDLSQGVGGGIGAHHHLVERAIVLFEAFQQQPANGGFIRLVGQG